MSVSTLNEKAMIRRKQAVEAKVEAVNLANSEALRLHPLLSEALAPFVGKKITKVDGTLLGKVKEALPKLPDGGRVWVYFDRAPYSVRWSVKVCISYDQGCTYHEEPVTIGELDGCVLKALTPISARRTDYTVREVLDLHNEADRTESAHREALSALFPFGRYDR